MLPILLVYGALSIPALAQAYLSLTIRSLIPPADTIAFGRLLAGRMENVYGFIQYCDKCDAILPFNTPWILLTSLSRNSLESKLQAAVEKKATAVIIIADNVVDSVMQSTYFIMKSALERKYGLGSLDIPVILVSREDGGELAAISQFGGNVPVILEPTTHNHSNKNSILILTVVVLVASVIGGICYSMYQRRDIVPPIIRACPYQIAVSKIPSQELTDTQDPACDDEMKCAICLEGFQLNEVISHLPCKHVFHKDCIDPWLIEKRLCPMCKMDVVKFYGAVNIGSEESIVDIPLDEPTVSNNDADELIDED